MNNYQLTDWLPITKKETDLRGWDGLDVVLITGDAYVDHPAFGAAVIGRIIEREGFKIALVPQPNYQDDLRDFRKFGKPRLFFGVTSGNMDSMVNHYTANKRLHKLGLKRMFLHAAELHLAHPLSGEPLHLHAPLPEELQRLITLLGYQGLL